MFMTIETKDNKKQEPETKEEEYQFIQEEIAHKKREKWIKLIGKTMIAAVLFGVVGGAVFAWSGSFFFGIFHNDINEEVISFTTTKPEETEEPVAVTEEPDDKKQQDKSEDKNITVNDYAEQFSAMTTLADEVNKSIVTVSGLTEGVDWFDNPIETEKASYGLIIANNGRSLLILTNYKKIKEAKQLQVRFADGNAVKAKLYGKDSEIGLAVIGVSLSKIPKEVKEGIEVAKLGDTYNSNTGMVVLSLGSPNGHMYSMDIGFINGKPQDKYITDYKLELYYTSMQNYNNGEGVIVNLNGEIIGITTHDFNEEGNETLHTFFGISRLKPVIEKLVNKQEQVYVGLVATDVTAEYASSFGVQSGIYITEVVTDSPAYNAELKPGYLVTEINGENVTSMISYYNILSEYKVKDEIKMTIIDITSEKPKEKKVVVTVRKRE